jgi:quercetin dioxygenase-like cupin family protein
MTTRPLRGIALVALAAALALAPLPSRADEVKGPTRGDSEKLDLAGVPDREVHMVWVDFAPGATESPHRHNAELFGFVVDGTMTFHGEGAEKKVVKAGGMFHVLPRQVHYAANESSAPARLAVVFVAEKGKPLTEKVKQP